MRGFKLDSDHREFSRGLSGELCTGLKRLTLMLASVLLASLLVAFPQSSMARTADKVSSDQTVQAQDPTELVNVFIGTAASSVKSGAVPGGVGGGTQPAATVPFGLVQIGPDTDKPETSGYKYENTAIRHFSFTHLNGPGCRNTAEFAFNPFVGQDTSWPAISAQTFSHANEVATPGYYKVSFDNGITTELTASERTGFIRLNFPSTKIGEKVGLMVNTNMVGDGASTGSLRLSPDKTTILGEVTSGKFCASKGIYKVYLALRIENGTASFKSENGIARLTFTNEGRPLTFKAGISLVSTDGALLNLKTEAARQNFDTIRAAANEKWRKALSTIQIETSAPRERQTVFYTALYHSLLHPNLGSDVDGRYLGFDSRVHQQARDYYVNFSGWDIYRSQVQLLALLFPKRASDMAQSLVLQGQQGGALPKWSLNNVETNIMSGDPGALIVASIHAFGGTDFDRTAALKLMIASATDPSVRSQGQIVRHGAADYNSLGYIRHSKTEWASASTLLEIAVADNGVAHFAQSLGDTKTASFLTKRSGNWLNIWDPNQKYIRPRLNRTDWVEPFDRKSTIGFMEGNSAQYTWMIPHDLTRLISNMGGDDAAISRLDEFVANSNAGQNEPHLYLGNEPAFGAPWIYLWAHAPWRTQEVVRNLLSTQFKEAPGGLAGNDDLGALSSWGVWSAIGLYPAIPGSDLLVVGSPEFSKIKIAPEADSASLGRSETNATTLLAPESESKIYVKNLEIEGHPTPRAWFSFKTLRESKTIRFTMSETRESWGGTKGEEPPSGLF